MAEYNPSKIIKDGNTYNFRDTTKIPLAGSDAISGSLIPATTDAYDLGGSSYQWNNAYIKSLTINGVACGDILTHNVSEFVDVTSAQTVAGNKEFTGTTTAHDVVPSATDTYNLGSPSYQWNNAYATAFNGDVVGRGALSLKSKSGTSRIYLRNNSASAFPSSVNLYSKVGDDPEYGVFLNGRNFHPNTTDAMNLGTANLKWKSFNGINPGALSLPSNSYINIDTTDWDLTCQNELMGSFTPTASGWLMLHVVNSGTNEVNFWVIGGVIRINNKSTISTVNNSNFNMITIPVEKDKTYTIYGNASEYVAGRSIEYCRFMPCQGNV